MPAVVARRRRRERQPLGLDVLGHLAQRDLAQRGEVLDLEEAVERRLDALAGIDLARPQALDQRLRREVDEHDLVGRRRAPRRATSRARACPVSSVTWSLSDSRCWTLTVEKTSMPGGRARPARRRSAWDARARARWCGRARRSGTAPAPRARIAGQVHLLERARPGSDAAPGHDLEAGRLRRGRRAGDAARGSRSRRRARSRPRPGPPAACGRSCRRRRPCRGRPCGARSRTEQVVDDQVDQLDADERGDQAAEAVDQQVAPQQRVRARRAVAHAAQRQRDEQRDHERVEDDRRDDRALRRARGA